MNHNVTHAYVLQQFEALGIKFPLFEATAFVLSAILEINGETHIPEWPVTTADIIRADELIKEGNPDEARLWLYKLQGGFLAAEILKFVLQAQLQQRQGKIVEIEDSMIGSKVEGNN